MRTIGRSAIHAARHYLGLDDPQTQTTSRERAALVEHARGKRRAVEIGVYEAANTALIAQALASDGTLYAIDPFFRGRIGICWGEVIAHREVQRRGVARRIRFLRALSHEACRMVDGGFDFVFVDGDHSLEGITRDWSDWAGRIDPGCVIALHDTRVPDHDPSVAELGSAHYFESHIRHDPRFDLVDQVDSLSILRRVPV